MNGQVSVRIGGKSYEGEYELEDNLVTVWTAYGTKTTQQGGLPLMTVARMLLGEIVRDARAQAAV